MIDFTEPTNQIYDLFGVSATHYASSSDSGISCTVLQELQGQERTEYGVQETAKICVRKSEVSNPKRSHTFEVDGRTWQIEYILPADEGTNELETALACVDMTHLGVQ